MFGLKKNKKKSQLNNTTGADSSLVADIHTMPERFYVTAKKKRSNTTLLVVAGIIILGIAAAAALYVWQMQQTPSAIQPIVEQPSPVVPVQQPSTVATTTEVVVEIPLTPATVTPTTTPGDAIDALAEDADADGLTAAEEILYATNATKTDSDSDGFIDGAEVRNGYDPIAAKQTLLATNRFTIHTHPKYRIAHPTSWTVREQDTNKTETLFVAETGEFVEVLLVTNPVGIPLRQWFEQQFNTIALQGVSEITLTGAVGYYSEPNRTYYLSRPGDNSTIFLLTYNTGDLPKPHFDTTFAAIAKLFELLSGN